MKISGGGAASFVGRGEWHDKGRAGSEGTSMTEAEWTECREPQKILDWLKATGKLSDRKARLFAVAVCRRIWPLLIDERSRQAVGVVEQSADGMATEVERVNAHWACGDFRCTGVASYFAANAVGYASGDAKGVENAAVSALEALAWAAQDNEAAIQAEAEHHVGLLRDIIGSLPFREVGIAPSWLTWNDGIVVKLAQAAYNDRHLPEGTLDTARLAVLADALEEAGVTDAHLLDHLRGPGPHWRGCWALDALLGLS